MNEAGRFAEASIGTYFVANSGTTDSIIDDFSIASCSKKSFTSSFVGFFTEFTRIAPFLLLIDFRSLIFPIHSYNGNDKKDS